MPAECILGLACFFPLLHSQHQQFHLSPGCILLPSRPSHDLVPCTLEAGQKNKCGSLLCPFLPPSKPAISLLLSLPLAGEARRGGSDSI